MGLTDDQISSALRKSGIEGFVAGPTNAQYEVVLLDPNDELGIGKNINVQDATETDFVNNQSKVNQIDELVIDTPTNVVDYQDTGIGGRPLEIENGIPVDANSNPINSLGAADETITIYRVVPEGIDNVNANDWVFINKGQAEEALKNANTNSSENFKVIELEVSKGDVYPSAKSGNLEMGYFPTDTPTNVVPNVETLNIDDYKPFTLEVTDPAGLHARPAAGLLNDLQSQGLKLILMEDGVLKEVGLTGILKRGIPVNGTLELFVPKDLISIDMGDGSRGYRAQTTRGTLRVMDDASVSVHSDRIRQIAQDYHKIMGYSDPEFKPAMVFNDEIGAVAADIFEKLPMFEDTAIPYYRKFIQETNMQYQVLLDNGMQFEIVDADPYTPNKAGHQQMINDMENGVLKVLATEFGFGDEATSKLNPMLAESTYTDINGRVMLENDVFRAVHDTFGHGMRGNTFGPIGEYNAWLAHKEMYSSDARRVMTTETLGQNTFTNYGPHMRDANGNLLGKADAGYIKPADRPFASQKVALMPEEIIDIAGKVVEDASELVDTEGLNKLVQLANTQPEVVDGIMKTAKNVVGKIFSGVAGVLDPGDVAITQGLTRVLPRLGLAAISAPALAAYIGYELSILAIDVGQAYNKAIENQGGQNDFIPSFMGGKTIEGKEPTYIDYDWKQVGKDTWEEFGEVSDTWSLSWKISEPIIDYAFKEYAKLQEDR
jgi:hypothetical protein